MNANGVDTNIVAQVAKRQKPETALPLNDPPTVLYTMLPRSAPVEPVGRCGLR